MRLLKPGTSYLWLFLLFVVIFLAGFMVSIVFFGVPKFGLTVLPVFGALLLLCQIHSGVALDSWWRAKYERGCWQYRALLALNVLWLIGVGALVYSVVAK
jgi:hypothetical protein